MRFFTWFSLLHHFIYKSTCICWICGYYADLLMEECLIYISLIIILSEYSSQTHVLVRYIVIETFLIVRIFQIYTEIISINTFKCNILLLPLHTCVHRLIYSFGWNCEWRILFKLILQIRFQNLCFNISSLYFLFEGIFKSLSMYNPLRIREVNWYIFCPVLWLW